MRVVGCALAALAVVAMPDTALACRVQPMPMSVSDVAERSVMIVEGSLSYRHDRWGTVRGIIAVDRVVKGWRQRILRVKQNINLACERYGWNPRYSRMPAEVSGRFYLFTDFKGSFLIARFEQTGRAT